MRAEHGAARALQLAVNLKKQTASVAPRMVAEAKKEAMAEAAAAVEELEAQLQQARH